MIALRIEPILKEDEAELAIKALRLMNEPGAHALADKIERALKRDRQYHADRLALQQAEDAARASRAADATLTMRQAECLAAVRAGHRVQYRWETFMAKSSWQHTTRSMGGALWRMVERLQEDGLMTKHNKLTPGGADRLARWEAANAGKFDWPVPEEAQP